MNQKEQIRLLGKKIEGFDIRFTTPDDAEYLERWFEEKEILKWFPMYYPAEIQDSIKNMLSYIRLKSCLTATMELEPVGFAVLWLHPYIKIKHQCVLTIIVDRKHRNKGIGTQLLRNLLHLAKDKFKLDLVHLEVYEGNPAKSLYDRFGFEEFGFQKKWVKDPDTGKFIGRHFMQVDLDRVVFK